jgi:TRAP-type C4-dicarboxylate transport system permease small subunit
VSHRRKTFVAAVRRLSELAGVLAAAMIALAVLIVCHLVFVRYFLNAPTAWQTEVVTYLLVGATLIGSPYVLSIGGHVSVDLLPHYLAARGRRRLKLLGIAAGIFFCLVLFLSGVELWYDAWSGEWLSETVWAVPLFIPYAALPLGFGLMVLQYVADLLEALASP